MTIHSRYTLYPILQNVTPTSPSRLAGSLQDGDRCDLGWDEFLELQLEGDYAWGSWFQHVEAWDAFIKANPDVDVHVVQFEKLKEDPEREIKALCHFLEKPDDLVKEISYATSFDVLRKSTDEKAKKESSKFLDENKKDTNISMSEGGGRVAGWRARFTHAQSAAVDARVAALAEKGCDLARRVMPYLN